MVIHLNATDIAERMNNELNMKDKLSQGYIEYLLCKVIRDYKNINFLDEAPIISSGDILCEDFIKIPITEVVRDKNGKEYRKLNRNEVIKKGAMHSWNNGELCSIFDNPYAVGETPDNFKNGMIPTYSLSGKRNEIDFYNPI